MKQLEHLIGKLIASKIGVHVFFCLLFVLLFAIPVVLSDNRGIGFPALLTCLFILSCTYAGRWSGKRWLSGGIRAPFLRSLLLSVLILSVTGAAGAAWLFRGSIPHYFVQYLAVCFPLVVLFIFFGLSIALVRNSILKQVNEARIREEQKESELRLLLSRNSFSDENGNAINTGFPLTTNSFKAGAGKTTLQIVKKMPSLSVLEQFIAGGLYKEGVAMGMRNLDELLLTQVTNK
jgi:hypothetical protein